MSKDPDPFARAQCRAMEKIGCPRCGLAAGSPCVRQSGAAYGRFMVHAQRWSEAVSAWRAEGIDPYDEPGGIDPYDEPARSCERATCEEPIRSKDRRRRFCSRSCRDVVKAENGGRRLPPRRGDA